MVKIMRAFVLLPLIFPGCSANYIQSTNNIAKFNVEVTPYNDSFLLCKITGNSLDSALYIKSYDIDYYEDRVHIYINKSLKKTGISSPYFVQFLISERINYVYLGDSALIWERD